MQAAPVTQTVKSKKKSKREQEEAAIQQARQAAEAAALAGVSVQVSGPSVLLCCYNFRQAAGAAALPSVSRQMGRQCVQLQYPAVPLSRGLLRWPPWQVSVYKWASLSAPFCCQRCLKFSCVQQVTNFAAVCRAAVGSSACPYIQVFATEVAVDRHLVRPWKGMCSVSVAAQGLRLPCLCM